MMGGVIRKTVSILEVLLETMRRRKGSRKVEKSPEEPGPSISTPAVSKGSKASRRALQSSISPVEGSAPTASEAFRRDPQSPISPVKGSNPPEESDTSHWETEYERDTDSPDPFASDENLEVVRDAPTLSADVRPPGRAYALDDDFPHFTEEKTPAPPPSSASASPPPPKAGPPPPPSPPSSLPDTESQPTPSQIPQTDPEPPWFTEQIAAIEDEMRRRKEAGPQPEPEPEPEPPRPIPVPLKRDYNKFRSRLLQDSRKYQRIRYGPEPMEHRLWRQFPLLKRTPEEEKRRRELFASPSVSEYIGFGVFFGLRRHPCFEDASSSEDGDEEPMEREVAESSDEESEILTPRRSKRVRFRR